MKTYVGTTLEPDDYRAFAIRAASHGMSEGEYLRKLALEAVEKAGLAMPTIPAGDAAAPDQP